MLDSLTHKYQRTHKDKLVQLLAKSNSSSMALHETLKSLGEAG